MTIFRTGLTKVEPGDQSWPALKGIKSCKNIYSNPSILCYVFVYIFFLSHEIKMLFKNTYDPIIFHDVSAWARVTFVEKEIEELKKFKLAKDFFFFPSVLQS